MKLTPAQRDLVARNLGLAGRHARRYGKTRYTPAWDEYESDGRLGLCLAALTYDPSRAKYSTWAEFHMRGVSKTRRFRDRPRGYRCRRVVVPGEQPPEVVTAEEWTDVPDQADPVPAIDAAETVLPLLDTLPAAVREVVWLNAQGYTFREIGRRIGRSATRAQQVYRIGLAALRSRAKLMGMTDD